MVLTTFRLQDNALKAVTLRPTRRDLLLCISILVILCSTVLSSQNVASTSIPTRVLDSLYHRFPHCKVQRWEREDTVYVAHIKMNSGVTECAFSKDGAWLETETSLKLGQLPPKVHQAWTASEYSRWLVVAITKSQSPNGDQYEIEVRKGKQHLGLHYDAAGTFLRSEKE